jgi:hypothetical protein
MNDIEIVNLQKNRRESTTNLQIVIRMWKCVVWIDCIGSIAGYTVIIMHQLVMVIGHTMMHFVQWSRGW